MSTYALSLRAEADIEDMLVHGMRQFGEAQARRYHAEILGALDVIGDFPLMARERTEFPKPVRIHHHRSHYIAYDMRDGQPFVLRIVRDEMDLMTYLKRLG
jgi:toxin ParE1/3/4